MRIESFIATAAAALVLGQASMGSAQCPPCNSCIGDCPPTSGVQLADEASVAEIIKGVDSLSSCPKADGACDGTVDVSDLVQASLNYQNSNCAAGAPTTTSDNARVGLDAEAACIGADGSLNLLVSNDSGVVNAAAAQARIHWPSVISPSGCSLTSALSSAGWSLSNVFDEATGDWVYVIYHSTGIANLASPFSSTTALECGYHVNSGTPKDVYQVIVSGGVVANANGAAMATLSNPGHINVNCP
jgi:hypothetical protein